MPHARIDGRQCVGDRVLGVVMRVNAQSVTGHALDHFGHDLPDFVRKSSAIGVTQHHPASARLGGGGDAVERIVGIGLEPVEEMLSVEHRFPALRNYMRDGLPDGREVFLERRLQRRGHMEVMGLANEADGGRAGADHCAKHGVVRGADPHPLGHAERGHARSLERRRVPEEGVIHRIGARPAAFHVIDAQLVQRNGDGLLGVHREVDALGLLTVTQRRIEDGEADFFRF